VRGGLRGWHESLKRIIRWLYWPGADRLGRGAVIGLIYLQTPLPPASVVRRRRVVEKQKLCVHGVFVRRAVGVVILTARHFPPVTLLNEAPKTLHVCLLKRLKVQLLLL